MSIVIPAAVVVQLREALYLQLGWVSEEMGALVVARRDVRGEWPAVITRLDRVRALLGVIGWNGRDPEEDAEVDLATHGQVVVEALHDYLPIERSLMREPGEHASGQRARARARVCAVEAFAQSAGLDLTGKRVERRITIPVDFMGLLVESLLSELRVAAQHVEDAGLDPAGYPGPLASFDAIRRLLDVLGWGEHGTAEIDLDDHEDVLARVLGERLAIERDSLADADRDPAALGAREQRERAYAYTLQIEGFMLDAGLEILQPGERDV